MATVNEPWGPRDDRNFNNSAVQAYLRSNNLEGGTFGGTYHVNHSYTASQPEPSQPSNSGGSSSPPPSSGGSSGGSVPAATNYDPYLSMLNAQLEAQAREEQAARERTARELEAAYTGAYDRVTGRFGERGLDASLYDAQITDYLTQIRNSVPEIDAAPGQYFTGDLTGSIIDRITNDQIYGYTGQLNQQFGPGYVDNYFSYDYGGDVLDAILNTERADATQLLDNALARGNTTFQGYSDALTRLGDAVPGIQERLGDSARGVIEGYRQQLQGIGDTARQNLSTFQLGSTFDPQNYVNQLNDLYGNLQGSFEGDVRNTLGSTPLFDFEAILQRANAGQPASNDQAQNPNVLAAIEQRKQEEDQRRGLGTSGTF